MLLYMHGFASGPDSDKARLLSRRFAEAGAPLHLANMTPGEDGFERSSPTSMLSEVERILATGRPPHGIIGSSLGGYLAAVAAGRDPGIERLVLLAPAFRLFERWDARLTADARADWKANGLDVFHYGSQRQRRLGWQFHEDARGYPPFPEVKIPALCIAGRRDQTIPLEDVAAFVARTPSARLVEVDDGHELASSLDLVFEEAWRFLRPLVGSGSLLEPVPRGGQPV